MPYNNNGEYMYDRVPGQGAADPYRVSAEKFAKWVEEYLYDTVSPRFRDPHFLAWAIAVFDRSKQGSGNPLDSVDYELGVANVPHLEHPPVAFPAKNGDPNYKVEYPRSEYSLDQVPTNHDGTQPEVTQASYYQLVKPPRGR